MDWNAWAERATASLDMTAGADPQRWVSLFATGGTYADPVNAPTADLASIFDVTQSTFPDWHMTVTSAAGDDHQGVMEWISDGTLVGGPRITLRGCSVIHLDGSGSVLRWRDYFDMADFERQARAR
jgi:hypothetical protein